VELLNALLTFGAFLRLDTVFRRSSRRPYSPALSRLPLSTCGNQIIPDGLVIAILILGVLNSVYQIGDPGGALHTFAAGILAASLPLFCWA
jgi:hypothetical protein